MCRNAGCGEMYRDGGHSQASFFGHGLWLYRSRVRKAACGILSGFWRRGKESGSRAATLVALSDSARNDRVPEVKQRLPNLCVEVFVTKARQTATGFGGREFVSNG